jgi:hypothetical protein
MAILRYGCCRRVALIAGFCGVVAIAPAQGWAQSLSEKLTSKIGEAQKAEVGRNFERALSAYDEALRVDSDAPDFRKVLSSTLAKNLPVHRAREMWNMGSFSTIS